MSDKGTVLVTGGSGFIGGYCVISLLQQGWTVRTTVRDLARAPAVRANLAKVVDPGERLSFFAADLMSDDGWDAAAEGCDYVMQVASPLGIAEPKDPNVLITPAREGAKRAVGAAIKAGAKRVVMTSSVAATSLGVGAPDGVADETVWTDLKNKGESAYTQSKVLAEKAAWDLIAEKGGSTTMATVHPALVIGPVLSDDYSGSVQVIERLLAGRVPGLPRFGFNFVDVRDVAELHLLAMTAPEAAGQRFIAAGQFAWMADVADLLRTKMGAQGAKVPTMRVPDFVLRVAAIFDKELTAVVPGLGKRHDFSSEKAQRILGWKHRSLEDAVLDCARSLIAEGVVKV